MGSGYYAESTSHGLTIHESEFASSGSRWRQRVQHERPAHLRLLSKEFKLKSCSFRNRVLVSILDSTDLENDSVVVKDWVVVEGYEARGRVSSYHSKGTVKRSHADTQADKGVA